MKKTIALSLLFTLLLSSCYVNRTTVGYGPVGETLHSRTFSAAKQHYILFGLVRLNNANPQLPPTGVGFEIKSGFTLVDGLLTLITAGIYGQRTVKILVDKNVEQAIEQRQKAKKAK